MDAKCGFKVMASRPPLQLLHVRISTSHPLPEMPTERKWRKWRKLWNEGTFRALSDQRGLCPRDNVRGLQWRSHSPFSLPFHHFDLGMRHQCECYRRIGCHSITISKCSTANAIFQGFSTFPGTSCGIRSFFLRNRTTVLLKLPLFVLK